MSCRVPSCHRGGNTQGRETGTPLPQRTTTLTSQEAEEQGLKGQALESDRSGSKTLVSTHRLCDQTRIPSLLETSPAKQEREAVSVKVK